MFSWPRIAAPATMPLSWNFIKYWCAPPGGVDHRSRNRNGTAAPKGFGPPGARDGAGSRDSVRKDCPKTADCFLCVTDDLGLWSLARAMMATHRERQQGRLNGYRTLSARGGNAVMASTETSVSAETHGAGSSQKKRSSGSCCRAVAPWALTRRARSSASTTGAWSAQLSRELHRAR